MPSAAGLPTLLPLTAPADSLRPARPARLSLGLVFGLNSTRRSAGSLPASLASSEQPGPGNSAEVAARYQLSRNVWLRAGAGYAVNRQSVAFTLEKRQARWVPTTQLIVRTIQGRPDTLRVTTYVQRDSVLSQQRQQYRLSQQYFTVPLAGEWRFRTPSRWQPVLSLGATMTWLLRGTYLAQKDDCNCQTETQRGAGAGPLRPASAALTAGVGLDYALGLRSTLLLRPTGTYWLSSSGRMGGGRPLSVGLQVGLLFDTRRSR